MTQATTTTSKRYNIVAKVRETLAREGRSDIEVKDEWLGEMVLSAGQPVPLLTAPIGRGTALPIFACNRGDWSPAEVEERFVGDLVRILPLIPQARWSLRRYAGEVRRAAERAVAAANEAGIEIALEGVSFRPTRSFHLALKDWREMADHVLAEIRLTVLDEHLRSGTETVIVEEAADVADALSEFHDEQLDRQTRRTVLRRHGAQVRVDEVTLRLLARYGIEAIPALRQTAEHGRMTSEVRGARGGVVQLSLRNDAGTVQSSIIDDPAFVWNYDQLQAEGEGANSLPLPELGGPVGQVCPDDLYAGIRITAVRPWGGSCLYTLQQRLFFVDVVEGRMWEDLQAA